MGFGETARRVSQHGDRDARKLRGEGGVGWVEGKGQPKTEEVIPLAALKESINKAAYAFTEKHLGPKEEIGNKGGSLSNRLRAAIKA